MNGGVSWQLSIFIYDVIKITILLCLLIFSIWCMQSFFPPERSKKILGCFHSFGFNIIYALLGMVTPFCSSIHLFIEFTSAGLEFKCHIFFFYLCTYGWFRKPCFAYEHFRGKSCSCVSSFRLGNCSYRWNNYWKTA